METWFCVFLAFLEKATEGEFIGGFDWNLWIEMRWFWVRDFLQHKNEKLFSSYFFTKAEFFADFSVSLDVKENWKQI